MKGMHLTLDSWRPHRHSEGWEHNTEGMGSDLSEDNLGGEAWEALVQITGITRKGDEAEKGEPQTVRAAQRCFSYLQVLERLTRDNYPLLQTVRPTQIAMDRYGLGDAYNGVLGSVISMPKEGIDGIEYGPVKVHARHGGLM